MGPIAGVTAEETHERVLGSAARVFARKSYDGASIADIASEAGVSSGAIYAHFASKAELFAATLYAHGAHQLERLLALGGTGSVIADLLRERGVALAHRDPEDGSLLVEAIVAAKRHPEVAALLISQFADRESRFAELLRAGQRDGSVDGRLHPSAVARFVTMLVLGSVLVSAMDLPAVDRDEWSDLIVDLVARFTPRGPTT